MYTLSSAVQNLDGKIAQQQQSQQHEQAVNQRADIIQALTQHNDSVSNPADPNQPQHLDGQPQNTQLRVPNGVKIVIQEIARRFRPYNTPPVPVAMSEAELEAREAESAEAESSDQTQSKSLQALVQNQSEPSQPHEIVLTVHEPSDLQTGRFFTPHNAPGLEMPGQDQPNDIEYREVTETDQIRRPNGRRIGSISDPAERRRRYNDLYAISVKRQRKLKMKKHKYKKLMRRTRNLRRRQGNL